jgi:hypothetical protein
MRRENEVGGAVSLRVTHGRPPGLRFEVASGNRLLLRQGNDVVLFSRTDPRYWCVRVYRTGAYQSIIPPLRADQGRRPAGSWEHRFAGWLDAAGEGPLYEGRWLLHLRQVGTQRLCGDLVRTYPAGELDWLDGWNGVVPLRMLPEPDSARVKAYRRQAREQTLPPLLLWWVSGLDGFLLLDGHARLVAAHAERVEPAVLTVAAVDERHSYEPARKAFVEKIARGVPGAERALESLENRAATEQPPESRTRAWPLLGGAAEWDRLVAGKAPGWL